MKPVLTLFIILLLAPLARSEAAVPDFEKEVLPVLEMRCFDCHVIKEALA